MKSGRVRFVVFILFLFGKMRFVNKNILILLQSVVRGCVEPIIYPDGSDGDGWCGSGSPGLALRSWLLGLGPTDRVEVATLLTLGTSLAICWATHPIPAVCSATVPAGRRTGGVLGLGAGGVRGVGGVGVGSI